MSAKGRRRGASAATKSPGAAQQADALARAAAHYREGRAADALRVAADGLAESPDDARLWNLAAAAAHALGQFGDAEQFWRTALAHESRSLEALYNLGALLRERRRLGEAEGFLRRTLELSPDHAHALNNLGAILYETGRRDAALELFRQSLAADPDNAASAANLGAALYRARQFEEAEQVLRQSLSKQETSGARTNLGHVLHSTRRFAEAEQEFRRAVAIDPGQFEAEFNLSLTLLIQGKFEEGWHLYEKREDERLRLRNSVAPAIRARRWQGEDLNGRRLLIWREQGFGDQIQFSRYASAVREKYPSAFIGLACAHSLVSLLKTLSDIDAVHDAQDPVAADYDYWVFPLSLPRLFHTDLATLPARIPYLDTDAQRRSAWRERVPAARYRIGIAWQGNANHPNDADRSIADVGLLGPIARLSGVQLISLQKDGASALERARLPAFDASPWLDDFAATAALMAELDLVITIDSALAHLAGALDRPAWVLLPYVGVDWRWLPPRGDSPWYPGSMRLFHQGPERTWAPVIASVVAALVAHDPGLAEGASLSEVESAMPPGSAMSEAPPATSELDEETAARWVDEGQFERALRLLSPLLTRTPERARLWNLAALCAHGLGLATDAERFWRTAVAREPGFVDAHYNLGVLLLSRSDRRGARQAFEDVLRHQNRHAQALNNLGKIHWEEGREDDAIAAFRSSLAIEPRNEQCLNNLASIHFQRRQLEEAEQLYRQCLAIRPDVPAVLNSWGSVLGSLRRFDEAAMAYRRALALAPGFVQASANLGMVLLAQGQFEEGWRRYEDRHHPDFKARFAHRPKLPFPAWAGEDLRARSLLVWYEQGFGDEIQFCRYLPLLKQRFPQVRIGVVCKQVLVPLLETLGAIDQLHPAEAGRDFAGYDFWTLPLSLPALVGTTLDTIPAQLPYLSARAERAALWAGALPNGRPRVGLVWRGNPAHANDANRSLPSLLTLASLWEVEGASFVSLQLGGSREMPGDRLPLVDVTANLLDFGDSAAIIAGLDLVITVDTAMAHLAGALGKRCWLLLPRVSADWRWLDLRRDSPWYPGVMRLYWQNKAGRWDDVVAQIRDDLAGLALELDDADPRDALLASHPGGTPVAEVNRPLTDMARWSDAARLDPAWAGRSQLAARFVPAGTRVLDFGCGAMHLERHLPWGCSYQPSDVVARDSRTLVCNLNDEEPPRAALAAADLVTMLGVLEYLHDPRAALSAIRRAGCALLCSYCPADRASSLDRPALGWVNQYSADEFVALVESAGFTLRQSAEVDGVQLLYQFEIEAATPTLPSRRVHVLSYLGVPNFGDRLGFHVLSDLLPAEAVVSWGGLYPLQGPARDVDLVVLGIGNSLYGNLLNDDLMALVERYPTVGIFGTQYRNAGTGAQLDHLIDRLLHWYARYEEDVRLFGRGHSNVSHLGDWLIRAFAMTEGLREERLTIDTAVCNHPSLDRVIQTIQQYREVYSTRLHPLLCALTSASRVAYQEQRADDGLGQTSGKFRSLLVDVFGREYPERETFNVDRQAVARYKERVHRNVAGIGTEIHRLLGLAPISIR